MSTRAEQPVDTSGTDKGQWKDWKASPDRALTPRHGHHQDKDWTKDTDDSSWHWSKKEGTEHHRSRTSEDMAQADDKRPAASKPKEPTPTGLDKETKQRIQWHSLLEKINTALEVGQLKEHRQWIIQAELCHKTWTHKVQLRNDKISKTCEYFCVACTREIKADNLVEHCNSVGHQKAVADK